MHLVSKGCKFIYLQNCKVYFPTYTPFNAAYFSRDSINVFTSTSKKVYGLFEIQFHGAISAWTSDEKCWAFKVSFDFGNNLKSDSEKSSNHTGSSPLGLDLVIWITNGYPQISKCGIRKIVLEELLSVVLYD